MEPISLCNGSRHGPSFLHNTICSTFKRSSSSSSSSSSRVRCCSSNRGDEQPLTVSRAYGVLGLAPQSSSAQIKSAFRAKVKQFHPDVMGGAQHSDAMIRRVIQAYQDASNRFYQTTANQRLLKGKGHILKLPLLEHYMMVESMDPFDQPECEAYDVFVNEVLCMGKGCPYSCVSTAPHAFGFSSATGTAYATSQGHNEDYQVQRAVNQCPRTCIHYVTPSQRIILEELLESILNMPYDTSAEAEFLYSLIVKAQYENNRYQSPKKNPKASSKHVDWF